MRLIIQNQEKERLFAGMTVLSIINIFNLSDNGWNGYYEWIQSILYFEKIIQQSIHDTNFYNYDNSPKKK